MKSVLPDLLERGRHRIGIYASDPQDAPLGAFTITHGGVEMHILSSGVDRATGWEHVSVSVKDRCPTWEEMCFVKDCFWNSDECVVQYHPTASEYVNVHPYCLHLWRYIRGKFPTPPTVAIGIK